MTTYPRRVSSAEAQYRAFDLFENNFLRQTGWETVFADKVPQFEFINDDDDKLVIEWKTIKD